MTERPGEVEVGGYARLDVDRRRRTGIPEVVYGAGKTTDQVLGLLAELRAADPSHPALATRCGPDALAAADGAFPGEHVEVDPVARTIVVGEPAVLGDDQVLVLTAGTTDLPVARECLVSLRALGVCAELVADVGVAGLHRLLGQLGRVQAARFLVVVAGMDGALAGVVAGLTKAPVVAVPTSVGYGVAAGGVAAALTMLSTCSPGLVVTNIDNGFGAAVHVTKCLRAR